MLQYNLDIVESFPRVHSQVSGYGNLQNLSRQTNTRLLQQQQIQSYSLAMGSCGFLVLGDVTDTRDRKEPCAINTAIQ